MAGILINEGTQTNIAADAVGTQQYPYVKLDIGAAGAASAFTGTLGAITNLVGGTITKVNGGTVVVNSLGTLSQGTVQTFGQRHADEFATVISSGTSTLGTIKAAVSGSAIYVTNMVISSGSATNIVIASGGTSTPIGGTFFFNANGGMVNGPIDPPWRTASGSALVFKQSTDGPLTITATGYVD